MHAPDLPTKLASTHPLSQATGKKAYVIGEVGIGQELDLIGVPWFGAEDFKGKEPDMSKQGKVRVHCGGEVYGMSKQGVGVRMCRL